MLELSTVPIIVHKYKTCTHVLIVEIEMATTGNVHNTGQLERFTNNLWQHQQNNKLCDFTLSTNNASIECHKLVLASASSYFSQVFCDSEHQINIIDVTPVPLHILRTVVAFMYNSTYVIDDGNVVELLNLGGTWNLDILITLCASYINDNVTIYNACKFYRFNLDIDDTIQFQALNMFIREHFKSLDESNELRQVSLKNYINIIDHDEINVENEDAIFSNAVQIIEQQTSVEDTRRCLELIRYPYLSSDYLIEVVQEHPLMKEPPQNGYVREALKYHVSKSPTEIDKPRRTWNDGTCTYYIAPDMYVYSYATKDGKDTCTRIINLSDCVQEDSAKALHGCRKCVIFVGGNAFCRTVLRIQTLGTDRVRLLNITNDANEARTLPDLPVRVYAAGIALSENNVYVIGGQKNESNGCMNSFFCLSLVNERWRKKRPMPHALKYPLAIHHQNFIFVLGGRLNSGELQSSVSKYNIRYNAWVRCSDMPTSCDSTNAEVVVHNGKIKVITEDKCLAYSDNIDIWSVKHFNKLGECVRVFVKRGHICAAVSKSKTKMTSHCVMCYDDAKSEWKTVRKIDNATLKEKALKIKDVCGKIIEGILLCIAIVIFLCRAILLHNNPEM